MTHTKYFPLTGIVEGKPKERALERRKDGDIQGSSIDLSLSDFERSLFEEKAVGDFLVFHESVLGMNQIYSIPESLHHSSWFYKVTFIDNRVHRDSSLLIPDAGSIESLKMLLPRDQLRQLEEFYRKTKNLSLDDHHNTAGFSSLLLERDYGRTKITNEFSPRLEVYHNGVRLSHKDSADLNSGDVVRIGPAIVFGYHRKEKE